MRKYKILPIELLDKLDFSNLDQDKETVKISLDGSLFIISGEIERGMDTKQMRQYWNENKYMWEPLNPFYEKEYENAD